MIWNLVYGEMFKELYGFDKLLCLLNQNHFAQFCLYLAYVNLRLSTLII